MGYRVRTNVRCTNPDLITSGSTFNKKWDIKNLKLCMI